MLGSSSRLAQGQALRNVLARARTWGASRLIEACPRTGLGSKTYWHEHEPEARRGSSRLGQEQASAAKRNGTSTNPRRVEAHRGLAKARPRQQNALAGACTEAAGTRNYIILLLESHPMAGLIVCQWVAFGWHPRILGRSWREGMASRLQTDIHTSTHTVIQTYIHTWLHTYILTDILTCKQSVPRQASNQALGLWKLLAMLWKLQQNRHFARRQASRQASRQAWRQALRLWKLP